MKLIFECLLYIYLLRDVGIRKRPDDDDDDALQIDAALYIVK
jgi:hypothetical protein